jgi:hypothetical protein
VIRLHKGAPPPILERKAAEWMKQYLDALAVASDTGEKVDERIRFRYRHKEIKAAIRRDSHNKCIYCESMVGFGETDHIIPVSLCPDGFVSWHNLALICKECNTFKSDYYDPDLPLINPYADEPGDHLHFFGSLVLHHPGNSRGEVTHRRLRLNRAELAQQRTERLNKLVPLLDRWASTPPGRLKDLLRQAVLDEASDNKEYAAMIRAYLAHIMGPSWPQTAVSSLSM